MSSEPNWPVQLFKELERDSQIPLHVQLANQLEAAIDSGALVAGQRLITEVEIAGQLGISRPTARQAIQTLVDKGMLVRRRGIGTQVLPTRVDRQIELTSLHDDIVRQGLTAHTKVIEVNAVNADHATAEKMGLQPGTELTHLRRLRIAGSTPIAILDNLVPSNLAELTEKSLAAHGLYALLEANGIKIKIAQQTIGARRASTEEAKLLAVKTGSPLLTMERIAYDHDGQAIELGTHCYNPELHTFATTLVSR